MSHKSLKRGKRGEVHGLVCARATEMLTIAGSLFHRVCGTCGARVMISPSGQRTALAKKLEIICFECAKKLAAKGDMEIMGMASTTEELRSELANVVPNVWRERN